MEGGLVENVDVLLRCYKVHPIKIDLEFAQEEQEYYKDNAEKYKEYSDIGKLIKARLDGEMLPGGPTC